MWRRGWFEEHRGGGPHRLLAADSPEEGRLGWASSSEFRPRSAHSTTVETSIHLRPGAPRRGLGSGLYLRLFELLVREDLERTVAGVTPPNPSSEALHLRWDFTPVGTFARVGRKLGHCWDVGWYEKALRPEAPYASCAGGEGGGGDR